MARNRRNEIIQGYCHAVREYHQANSFATSGEWEKSEPLIRSAATHTTFALEWTLKAHLRYYKRQAVIKTNVDDYKKLKEPSIYELIDLSQKYAEPPLNDQTAQAYIDYFTDIRNPLAHSGATPSIPKVRVAIEDLRLAIVQYLEIDESELPRLEDTVSDDFPTPSRHTLLINDLPRIARSLQRVIIVFGISGFLLIMYLQLKDLAFGNLVPVVNPDIVRSIALTMYLFSWLFGASFEIGQQQNVFFSSNPQIHLKPSAVLMLAGFATLSLMLISSSGTEKPFTLIFDAFLAYNLFGHYYERRVTRPYRDETLAHYQQDSNELGIYKLEAIDEYFDGRWQAVRFISGACLMAVMNVLVFNGTIRGIVSQKIASVVTQGATEPAQFLTSRQFPRLCSILGRLRMDLSYQAHWLYLRARKCISQACKRASVSSAKRTSQ